MTSAIDESRATAQQKKSETGQVMYTLDETFIKNNQIGLDITYIVNPVKGEPFISHDELNQMALIVVEKHRQLQRGEGDCRDGDIPMLGWQSLPDEITKAHLDEIVAVTNELAGKIDVFVSLGIGGSYLGIEATVKALTHTYFNELSRNQRGDRPQVYFLGQNTDPDFFHGTLDLFAGKRIGLNVISKSGTTTETAIAFRILRRLLEEKEGDRARELILATTDSKRGALRALSDQKGYKSFVIPNNIGGRFSVLTDVGLVRLAMAGIDIHEFVAGFRQMKKRADGDEFWSNPAMLHAAVRHLAYQKGKKIEVVATNSTAIYGLARWMEQLFPESEGHNGYGMWVSPSLYSEKLHANGQMVQDGERNILETFLCLGESTRNVEIPTDPDNLDGLNYLSDAGRKMNFINRLVIDGPAYAHFQGGVPNMTINIPRRNAFNIGQFYYLMERSVALSGYLAGHNPFVQPGVEAYKKAMFALAGKSGCEADSQAISTAINNLKQTVI
ncbi:MAG: glucose-6-phosphate isomerase [candidate division Zixibacteria bacterium]|nr:glucose-6-phosphate isomerase [candidate division Zixibacteria bacterium]